MLVNIIQNTISSFRSALAAASVITTNLKMWLGFETSETLGREEVLNGDFSNDTTSWSEEGSSTISVSTYQGKTDVANINILNTSNGSRIEQAFDYINGQTYQVSIEVYLVSGSFRVDSRDSFVADDFVSTTTTGSWQTLTATITAIQTGTDVIWLRSNDEISQFYVNSISIKEATQYTPDKSGNNNVGELFTGKALEFDGSTTYVSANSFAGTLSNNTAFTFAVWFNSEKTLPARFFSNILISSGGLNQETNIFKIGVNPRDSADAKSDGTVINIGGIYFDDSSGYNNVVPLSGGVNYNDGQWHRLVVSRPAGSGDQDLSFYVDGSLIGTADCNPFWNNILKFDFGQEWDQAGTSDHFEGNMSDIQVYDYAWDTDDVTYDYANPNKLAIDNPSTDLVVTNLKAYWAMSEGAGLVAYDSSGEGSNGTINGATYEPAQPRIPQLGMQNWSKGSNLLTYSNDFTEWLNPSSIAITPNYGTSPIGTQDASRVVFTGSSQLLRLSFTTTTNLTASIYMKGSGTIKFGMDSLEEVQTLSANWQRFIVSSTASATSTTFNTYGSTTARDIQVWGAQVEVGTSAGNYRLTDGGATLNSTVIPNPTIPTQDILGNLVRDRLNSFNLDGSGYAVVADDTDLDFGTGDFTLECWLRIDGNTLRRLLDKRNTTSGYTLYLTNLNVLNLELNDGTGNSGFVLTSSLNSNTWLHLAIVCDRSANATCYVNKAAQTPVNISSKGGNIDSTSNLIIGADAPDGLSLFSTDIISDVRLYKGKLLSATEVENNYNAGLSAHTN